MSGPAAVDWRRVSCGVLLGLLLLAVLSLVAGPARAAPDGSGWASCPRGADDRIYCAAPAVSGALYEYYVEERWPCTDAVTSFVQQSSVGLELDVSFSGTCFDGSGVVLDAAQGAWFRLLYVSSEPPGDPASSGALTFSDTAGAVQALFFLGVVFLGLHGYSVGSRDA